MKLNVSQKWDDNDKTIGKKKNYEKKYYRCGIVDHQSRTCCTTDHLVDLYQVSLKKKKTKKSRQFKLITNINMSMKLLILLYIFY